MIQTIEVDAHIRGERTRIALFSGERILFDIKNRPVTAEVVMTVGPNGQSDPLVELVGTDQVNVDAAALSPLTEGSTYMFNIWLREAAGMALLVYGDLAMRDSIQPTQPFSDPGEGTPDPLEISGSPAETAEVGVPYTFQPSISGGTGPYAFDLPTGTLPAGLSLDDTTGAISGMPVSAGLASGLTLRVTDDDGATATLTAFDITVTADDPLAISGTPASTATTGQAYDFAPVVTGGTAPFVFDLALGTLPSGLTLNATTGAISGTPDTVETATGLVLRVTDDNSDTATLAAFDIAVSDPVPAGLAAPGNLFTPAQTDLSETAHLDLRSNWEVLSGALSSPITGGTAGNDARLSTDTAMVSGHPYITIFDMTVTTGDLKAQLGGDGSVSGRTLAAAWQNFEYFPAGEVNGNYTRVQLNPSTDFAGTVSEVRLFDLSSVDPSQVACDVIIVGGDSNSANATSQKFGTEAGEIGPDARETPFDPRIWYMPCLRASPSNNLTDSIRHIPQPCIEPVATVSAQRMSPVHAVAGQIVGYSAARGRPLLVMALGDPGSGLMNTEDWRKTSTVPTTGSRMWGEMLAMKTALEALGPAHEIVGMVWSLGANDQFGGAYEANHGPAYSQFFADVRADIADVPMALWNIGTHMDSAGDGRSEAMRQFLRRFDKDSGDPRAVDRLTTVEITPGNHLSDDQDPHYDAHGMQQNGRDAGAALLAMLS